MKKSHFSKPTVLFQVILGLCYMLAGADFFIRAKWGNFSMSPEVYGDAVYLLPAEVWASLMFLFSSIVFCGCIINGSWRYSPYLRMLGWVLLSAYGFAFWHMADPGGILRIFAETTLIPLSLISVGMNIYDATVTRQIYK